MQTTIYINNKPVYLTDQLDTHLEQLHHLPETIFIDELDTHTIKSMLREIALPQIKQGIFLHNDLEALKTKFFKKFEKHVAGGGLVINKTNDILMIFRRGFWDLPKGHLDKGETIQACALREVQEETGLSKIHLLSPILITYHTYEHGTHHILKESHWFLMQETETEKLVPQTEEDIEKIEWVKVADIEKYLATAYPSITDVVKEYLKSKSI
ncbi:MAG TPA: NUDIX domain-containing protein [Niabella sp.]|nr:NUDIX domain-containing protein [Niabella sp.]HQW15011.1 NUDIX domain-containing protein [Niabella sp.]HQX20097.1 NUDIX domain-containing protein [Niabella sp.]HQX40391.1 NUDIX domain-containing protein [Niabella sp.]HRB06702.1 NUDIX domain-containing protein [Niabella sp.]